MKLGLKIYGGFCIGLFILVLAITLAFGLDMIVPTSDTVTAENFGMAVGSAIGSSLTVVLGLLSLFIAISVFCVFAVFLPLYILDIKGKDTRIYNIVAMCLFVVAVIVLVSVGAKIGSVALALLAVPAVPTLIYNAVSLSHGVKFEKKKALLKLNEGQFVDETASENKPEEEV